MKSLFSISLIPVLFFGSTILQPSGTADTDEEITWYTMEEAQKLAAEDGKKVMIYIMAEWCGYCKKMEKEVYPRTEVQKTLDAYYHPVMIDIESDNIIKFNDERMTEQQFARKYRVTGTPTHFFLNSKGEILGAQPGFIPADVFQKLLTYVGTDTYAEIKFEEYLKNEENDSGAE